MGIGLRVLTSIAAVGSMVGGGVALAHVPGVQQTAATTGQAADASGQTLQSLLAQSSQLHAAIEIARQGLAQGNDSTQPSLTPTPAAHQRTDRHTNTGPQVTAHPSTHAPALNPRPTVVADVDGDGRDDGHDADGDGDSTGSAAATTPAAPTFAETDEPSRSATPTVSQTASPTASPTHTRSPRPSPTWTRTRPPGGGDD